MASKNMPTASNARQVARPVQGNNSIRPLNRPRPAYRAEAAPAVVRRGTVSHPVPLRKWHPVLTAPNATPKRVVL